MLYRVRTYDDLLLLIRTEDFAKAKATADAHKQATGDNAFIESISTVYTTSTIDEALHGGPMPDAVATVRGADGKRRALPSYGIGDHPPERWPEGYPG